MGEIDIAQMLGQQGPTPSSEAESTQTTSAESGPTPESGDHGDHAASTDTDTSQNSVPTAEEHYAQKTHDTSTLEEHMGADEDGDSAEDQSVSDDGSSQPTLPDDRADEADDAEASSEEGSPDEGDSVFLKAEHSEYKSVEDAIDGINRKDEMIFDYKKKIGETEKEYQERLAEMTSKIEEYESRLEQYREAVGEDAIVERELEAFMPEEYKGKTEGDFTDEEDLVAFKKARLEARARFEYEREQKRKERERQQEALEEMETSAEAFVEETATKDFFDAKNPEESERLDTFLSQKTGDYTLKEQAKYITAAFGEETGKRFLEGLRREFLSERRGRVKDTVTETTKERPRKEGPKPPASPNPSGGRKMSSMDKISFGLKEQGVTARR